jgi:hypothetical protein
VISVPRRNTFNSFSQAKSTSSKNALNFPYQREAQEVSTSSSSTLVDDSVGTTARRRNKTQKHASTLDANDDRKTTQQSVHSKSTLTGILSSSDQTVIESGSNSESRRNSEATEDLSTSAMRYVSAIFQKKTARTSETTNKATSSPTSNAVADNSKPTTVFSKALQKVKQKLGEFEE